jgi:hypothetical protein
MVDQKGNRGSLSGTLTCGLRLRMHDHPEAHCASSFHHAPDPSNRRFLYPAVAPTSTQPQQEAGQTKLQPLMDFPEKPGVK